MTPTPSRPEPARHRPRRIPLPILAQQRKPFRFATPEFRLRAKPGSYRIREELHWKYMDRKPSGRVTNGLMPWKSNKRHLVLCDQAGQPRFVLQYEYKQDSIHIRNIQRERTDESYVPLHDPAQKLEPSRDWMWDAKQETKRSKEFQTLLGVHPGEFLLDEFLYRQREKIRQGMRIVMDINIRLAQLYQPYIRHYLRPEEPARDSSQKYAFVFELDLSKRRVADIVNAP